ncbi:MAG: hypothetical protein V7767_00735 [Leeuwenhoekiella sp.]
MYFWRSCRRYDMGDIIFSEILCCIHLKRSLFDDRMYFVCYIYQWRHGEEIRTHALGSDNPTFTSKKSTG